MRRVPLILGVLTIGCSVGCFGSGTEGAAGDETLERQSRDSGGKSDSPIVGLPTSHGDVVVAESLLAALDLQVLDIWGLPLPDDNTRVRVATPDDVWVLPPSALGLLPLQDQGTVEVQIEADGFDSTVATFEVSGSPAELHLIGLIPTRAGVASGVSSVQIGGDSVPRLSIYLGAPHQFFSPQAQPARRGNELSLLMDGERSWASVATDLMEARDSIHVSTWWWDSTFELYRDVAYHYRLTEAERRENTILSMLQASPAHKRVLVNQILAQDSFFTGWLTSDRALRAHGDSATDNFDYMGMANPTTEPFRFSVPGVDFAERARATLRGSEDVLVRGYGVIPSIMPDRVVEPNDHSLGVSVPMASWHQKFLTIDDRVAFIGGMNYRQVDWDTSSHEVFDARRMNFGSSVSARQAVALKEDLSDLGPRKDYMVRIDGPIVQDADDVFSRRWHAQLEAGAEYSENASSYSSDRVLPVYSDGVYAQVTATMPAPFNEYGIAESWLNAIAHANDYIYIEDQYFRTTILTDAIVARMNAVPGLKLIVVTKPISEWTDPGCYWSFGTINELKARFPGRFFLYQLRSFDYAVTWGIDETQGYFLDIDVHSKALLVDDLFASIGSANKNNRGMLYEGELAVAVFDRQWVTTQRRRILTNLLQTESAVSDDSSLWIAQLSNRAAWNDYAYDLWDYEGMDMDLDGERLPTDYTPEGFVYTLDVPDAAECLIEDIGEDVT